MATSRSRPFARRPLRAAVFLLAWISCFLLPLGAADISPVPAQAPLPPALSKPVPESIADLKAIQEQVKKVVEKVLPCTVGVRIGQGQGSGVIINAEGYVLTAAHVSGAPDRDVTLILSDGREVKGKTLGGNRNIDSGLIKISQEGPWPFVEMGNSADLKRGQWCVATGHPGGFKSGRTPVVRVGRILTNRKELIQTDCTLVGGDSGGPLFDLQGKVIGIHSRIGNAIEANIHVPVDTYRETWEKLAQGEIWGNKLLGQLSGEAYLGVQGDPEAEECKILKVVAGSPAEKAGFKENDVVTKFGGRAIPNFQELVAQTTSRRPGDEITVELQRGELTVTLKVVLGKRPS